MWHELYTAEKLREFERERLARRGRHPRLPEPRPVTRPLLRRAGRTLVRLGVAMERWGASPDRAVDGEPA